MIQNGKKKKDLTIYEYKSYRFSIFAITLVIPPLFFLEEYRDALQRDWRDNLETSCTRINRSKYEPLLFR